MDEITALLRRDPERALSKMLTAYTGLVYRAAAAVLGDNAREEVEECVNDAFLVVYKNRATLDFSRGSVKAYLCVTVRNLAIDHLKKRGRAKIVPLDEYAPSPERTEATALANIEGDALVERILALGEPDSTIIVCRYYFNMRTKQIAKKVGLKENTVDQRLRRALSKLRTTIEKGGVSHAE